ncbi:hypothetical protein MASR2M15_09950 [Anaerolineales bacterium]
MDQQSSPNIKNKRAGGSFLIPGLLILIAIILLINNFLLLSNFNILSLLPLALVILGLIIFVRGDLTLSTESRTFGITRGSIQSATIEMNSGEVDVSISSLPNDNQGRLIAGQYAVKSRPQLKVQDTYAHLIMNRFATNQITLADWEFGLANDLPWELLLNAGIGQLEVDCGNLILGGAKIFTGIGDIHFVSPPESLETIQIHSVTGTIRFATPADYRTRILIKPSFRFFSTHVNQERYQQLDNHLYESLNPHPDAPLVEVEISGYLGDVFLI